MADGDRQRPLYRFGVFALDLKAKELTKYGTRVKLQEQPQRILQLLLERPGEVVTRQELRQHLWPTDIYVDFDRNLNRAIVRLRQALADDPEAPRYVETLPRVGYRFIAPVEVAGGEIPNDPAPAAPVEAKSKPNFGRESAGAGVKALAVKVGLAAALLLAVLAAAFHGSLLHLWPANGVQAIRSVAVLPLRNLSGDASQDYFADGITEEITTDLSRVTALRVISATSARAYRNSNLPLPQIAQELNVDAVLEGSVTRSGTRVRVNAQLVDARKDVHLWAQIYDREAQEIAEIQDSISLAVASRLRVDLTREEREFFEARKTVVPDAYDAYLRGRSELGKQNQESLRAALASFQKAATLDRLYAPAYSGIADSYVLLANYGGLPPNEAFPKAKSAALKALDLDHMSTEAHTSLAFVRHHFDWDWAEAEKHYKTAIHLDPNNSSAHLRYAEFLSNEGRHDEAIREVRLAHELAPGSLVIQSNIGRLLYFARRYDDAIPELKTILAADPTRVFSRIYLALCYEQKGMYSEALFEYQKVTTAFNGQDGIGIAHLYANMGKVEEARRILAVQEQPSVDGVQDWFYIAAVHAKLDEKDKAFLWLEEAYRNHDFFLTALRVDPLMDPLRSDPRFKDLVSRMNFR